MELSNQQYFSDEQYIQFLTENSLTPTDEYDKPTMQKPLLFTVIDVLEAVTNDIDLMTVISTEFSNIGQAYEVLEARIQQMKDKSDETIRPSSIISSTSCKVFPATEYRFPSIVTIVL